MRKNKLCSLTLAIVTVISLITAVMPVTGIQAAEYNNSHIIIKASITSDAPEYYTNDGTTINFLQDFELDFSSVAHSEHEGKLFIGWADSEGNGVENNTVFTAGTTLTAKYINCNSCDQTDFAIVGTEIRTDYEPGLRFIIEKSNALTEALPDISEYGAIVLPSEILSPYGLWLELKCDTQYKYKNKYYTPAVITGAKTYETEPDCIRYTLCMTGLKANKLTRQYIVRGYIKYSDINGIESILYTDYASINPYAAAKETLKNENLSSVEIKLLENIMVQVDEIHSNTYDSQAKCDIVGTSADPDSWIYQLEDSKLFVREATFDSGKGGAPVEIVQLSDLHYNYINSRDREENNPTVMSTAEERSWGMNGIHAIVSRLPLDYARTADQIVITGDVMDYLSWGGAELMYREIWDKFPDAIITCGNHDFVQCMTGKVPETLTTATRLNLLQSIWKHDLYYSSKVLGDKVMIIQMNNCEHKFYKSQIEPLKQDIKTARENGYIVLLFMHQTLYTQNPDETAVNALRVNDKEWAFDEDFCDNPKNHHIGGAKADSATDEIYNVITHNADVIKGIFNGHIHSDFFTKIKAQTADGEDAFIPQYTLTSSISEDGHVMKITVK